MTELDMEGFSMESPAFRAHSITTGRILKKVEDILDKFYGDDHSNWHEMCLCAKKFIQKKQADEQTNNMSEYEMKEWARLALVHTMAQFEVH